MYQAHWQKLQAVPYVPLRQVTASLRSARQLQLYILPSSERKAAVPVLMRCRLSPRQDEGTTPVGLRQVGMRTVSAATHGQAKRAACCTRWPLLSCGTNSANGREVFCTQQFQLSQR